MTAVQEVLLGVVHKRCPQSGGGGLSSVDTFGQGRRGVLRMRTPALLAKKTSDFSKFIVCPHGQEVRREVSQCGHFADKCGRGLIFRDFVQTSFMDGPLRKILLLLLLLQTIVKYQMQNRFGVFTQLTYLVSTLLQTMKNLV